MRVLGILLLALTAAGCRSTMKDVYAEKAGGTALVYPLPVAKAWEVAGEVLWDATRESAEEHPDKDFLCVKGGLGDDVTYVGVWVEKREDPGQSLVTVVTRRASGIQVATVLTEEEFHNRFVRRSGVKPLKQP